MSYEVTVADVEARLTAVVAATTTWQAFPKPGGHGPGGRAKGRKGGERRGGSKQLEVGYSALPEASRRRSRTV